MSGVSSAFGGPLFHETDGQRMVGVPLEFRGVCELMRWLKSSDQLNVKTQLIGLAVGRREEIFPENCKWSPALQHSSHISSPSRLLAVPVD